jgi:hypothetical protein
MASTLSKLADDVAKDDGLRQKMQTDPEGALRQAAAAYQSDPAFYRIAIIGLMAIVVLVIVCAVVLQLVGKGTLPDWISAIGTTVVGGVVGLFAPSPADK